MNLETLSIPELGHHVGLPVDVNLQGMVVGGADFREEQWAPGRVAGLTEATLDEAQASLRSVRELSGPPGLVPIR
jgi:hypothetical protein